MGAQLDLASDGIRAAAIRWRAESSRFLGEFASAGVDKSLSFEELLAFLEGRQENR